MYGGAHVRTETSSECFWAILRKHKGVDEREIHNELEEESVEAFMSVA
jgi:hypothetical protein